MKTLKIEHLAPYLPYGVKVKVNTELNNKPYNIMTLCDKTGLSNLGISDFMDDVRCFKPILRPLSDITHEKMVEVLADTFGWGEKIVFKLYDDEIWVTSKGGDYHFDPEIHETESDYEYDYLDLQDEADGESVITCHIPFTMSQNLSWGTGDFQYFVCAKHYLRFTQELCKRHYDIFGLIAAGLAIDINTLTH